MSARSANTSERPMACSPATTLRRAGFQAAGGSPRRAGVSRRPRVLRDVVASDRDGGGVRQCPTVVPRLGVIAALRREVRSRESQHPYRITLTGIYGLADGIYRSLVGGLVRSLGWAIVISFVVFSLVLRSVRLALIALVPNLLPLVVTLGVMTLLAIDIKPTTVIIFSIALVIADDDTIQYLTRFRDRYAALVRGGHASPHREAALDTLRHTGPPMFATALSVAVGFSTLMFSEFLGLANLGLVTGLSLLAAFFADVFLTPLLLIHLRPRIRVRGGPI